MPRLSANHPAARGDDAKPRRQCEFTPPITPPRAGTTSSWSESSSSAINHPAARGDDGCRVLDHGTFIPITPPRAGRTISGRCVFGSTAQSPRRARGRRMSNPVCLPSPSNHPAARGDDVPTSLGIDRTYPITPPRAGTTRVTWASGVASLDQSPRRARGRRTVAPPMRLASCQSPRRARGERTMPRLYPSFRPITPPRAGRTLPQEWIVTGVLNHPAARGENGEVVEIECPYVQSPRRARGEWASRSASIISWTNHPAERGENDGNLDLDICYGQSPRRARGERYARDRKTLAVPITPPSAGRTKRIGGSDDHFSITPPRAGTTSSRMSATR